MSVRIWVVSIKQVNFRIPVEMDGEIEELSSEFGLSRSEVIRQALTLYLNIIGDIERLTNIRELSKEEMKVSQENIRDVHFINLDSFDISICISNTTSGGIGPKPHDKVDVDGEVVGSIIARTALIKMLSIKGMPTTIMLNFSNEYESTGKRVIKGVKSECKKVGIDNIVVGHSEENIETCQTGVTVTAIGILEKHDFLKPELSGGDKVICLGTPSVGNDILDIDLPQIEDIKLLNRLDEIKRTLPVGHYGVKKELEKHLENKNLIIDWLETDVDVRLSAGPSSAVIAIADPDIDIGSLSRRMRIPVNMVAEIKSTPDDKLE